MYIKECDEIFLAHNIEVKILASSSTGNCSVFDNIFMIDLGVPFNKIKEYAPNLHCIFITHRHGDHLNITTLTAIMKLNRTVEIYTNYETYEFLKVAKFKYLKRIIWDWKKINEKMLNNFVELSVKKGLCQHDIETNFYEIRYNEIDIFYGTDSGIFSQVNQKSKFNIIFCEGNYDEGLIDETLKIRLNGDDDDGLWLSTRTPFDHLSFQQYLQFCFKHGKKNSINLRMHISKSWGGI